MLFLIKNIFDYDNFGYFFFIFIFESNSMSSFKKIESYNQLLIEYFEYIETFSLEKMLNNKREGN